MITQANFYIGSLNSFLFLLFALAAWNHSCSFKILFLSSRFLFIKWTTASFWSRFFPNTSSYWGIWFTRVFTLNFVHNSRWGWESYAVAILHTGHVGNYMKKLHEEAWVKNIEMPYFKIGGKVYICFSEVNNMLNFWNFNV